MACRSPLAAVCLICAHTFTVTPPLYALFVRKATVSASLSCETEWKLLRRALEGCCDETKSQEHNPLPAPPPPPPSLPDSQPKKSDSDGGGTGGVAGICTAALG